MPNYVATAARAALQIERFGAPAVLTRKTVGDYDPNVGSSDDGETKVFNTFAIRGSYRQSEIDGTKIRSSDARLYLSPNLATAPLPGDVITFDGTEFLVVNSTPLKPATVVMLHDVQARGA